MLSDDNSEDLYQVEKIVQKRIDEKGRIMYYIQWQGHPEEANTWEFEENVPNIDSAVKSFEVANQLNTKGVGFAAARSKGVDFQQFNNRSLINNSKSSKKAAKLDNKLNSNDSSFSKIAKKTEVIDLTSDYSGDGFRYKGTSEENGMPSTQLTANLDIDIPYSIKCIKKNSHGTFAEVEWMPRSDGITPNNELMLYKIVREKYPQLLIDFYEDRIITNKTRISQK
jgi:hypothetical protein